MELGLIKMLRIMKLITILIFAACLQVSAKSYSQITLSEQNVPLQRVFTAIEKQTGYTFWYKEELLESANKVNINVKNGTLEDVLTLVFKDQPLTYSIVEKTVVVKQKIVSSTDVLQGFFPPPPIDIHGRITDPDGEPLVGATIKIKGSNTVAAITDGDGRFTLKGVDENATIEISYVGFVTQTIPVKNRTNIFLNLKRSDSRLDEVQVIAYGKTTQRLSTGNISSVSAREIGEQPVSNPLLALSGRVPGLLITQANGNANSGVTVRIQGINSIGNGSDPLYIVDGVPYSSQILNSANLGNNILGRSGGLLAGATSGGGGNPLSFINPSDIENIEVLKDADATAIYGSRAANGAILITTKKGKAGEAKAEINLQQGWGQVTKIMPVLSTREYLEIRGEAFRNDNVVYPSIITNPANTSYDINGLWDQSRNANWQKVLIGGTAQYTNVNLSISGGSEKMQFLVGGTFNRQTSVFPGDFEDQKAALHATINSYSSNHKFRFQFTGNYLYDNNLLPFSDLTNVGTSLAPDAPELYRIDGTLNWAPNPSGTSSWTNPLSNIYNDYQNKTSNVLSNINLSYKILPELEISSSFGYNKLQTNEYQAQLVGGRSPEVLATSFARTANYTYSVGDSWIIEPQVTYKRNIAKGKLDVLLGSTFQQYASNGYTLNGSGYNSDVVLPDVKSAALVTVGSSISSLYRYSALFSRINYNWMDKYIINLTARRDGSSRFGTDNQLNTFGAIGAAWIFSKENLINNRISFLSFGKFRGSYGTTGNDQIPDYQFMNLYNAVTPSVAYQGTAGLAPNRLTNPLIQWEETRKLSFGIDLGFFKDKILLSANYSHNQSSNELLNYNLPIITGFGSIIENFPATIQNNTWEFVLSTTNIKSKKFSWSCSFNLASTKNKLVDFPTLATSSYSNTLIIGQPITILKRYHFLGVDPATGIYLVADRFGNPTISPNSTLDNTALINLQPKFYGGLQNTFGYKGFQLDIFFQFVKQIGSTFYFGSLPAGSANANQPVSVLTRWQKPGDITNQERYNSNLSLFSSLSNAQSSDARYQDASYLRLKNVSLSYQLPLTFQHRMHIYNCKIYTQGQNLLTITRYKWGDPENQSQASTAPLKLLTVGLQIGL